MPAAAKALNGGIISELLLRESKAGSNRAD